MTRDERLSDQDLWQPDGHLSDLSLTALADGEPGLLSPKAASHADACDACAERLGQMATLSLSVSAALTRQPEPFPVWAVVAGLIFAGVGALPMLARLPDFVGQLPRTLVQTAPVALRVFGSMVRVASAAGPSLWVVWLGATLVMGVLGLAVAHWVPRRAEWKGAR